MATDNEIIYKVDTREAVKSVADLKENISVLKDKLNEGNLSWEEWKKRTQELRDNQSALKNAMYATNSTFEETIKASKGATESYNGLVKRMADLKSQLRETDVSTKAGQERFKALATEIKGVNDKLKSMDALQGNYQRNVGMYNDKIKNLGASFTALAGSASTAINPIKNVGIGLNTISKTPVVAVLALLANILSKVILNLRTSEANANSTAKAFSFLSGGADLLKGVMQTLGKAVASVGEWLEKIAVKIFPKLQKATELRKQITEEEIALSYKQREATMKNADAELEISKLREMASNKEKYSAKERLDALRKANDLALEVSQRNKEIALAEYEIAKMKAKTAENAKEENDNLAQAYAKVKKAEQDYFELSRSLNKSIASAVRESTSQQKEDILSLMDVQDKWFEKTDLAISQMIQANKDNAQMWADFNSLADAQYQETLDELDMFYAEVERMREEDAERAQKAEEEKRDAMWMTADATASVLGSLADLYEANEDAEGKNAEKAKNLRIASTTIETLSGAVSAYMACIKAYSAIPALGMAMGAVNAGVVMASGMANVAKIKATNTRGASSGSTEFASASVTAPSVTADIPQVRNITSASEETRLNRMAGDQRVYILSSDIEASQTARKTQIAESSF